MIIHSFLAEYMKYAMNYSERTDTQEIKINDKGIKIQDSKNDTYYKMTLSIGGIMRNHTFKSLVLTT